jgi:hypothetical protein
VESGGGVGRQEAASKSQERLQCHRAHSCPVQVSQSLSEFAAGSGFSAHWSGFAFSFFAYCVFSTKMAFIRFASCLRVLESSLFCTLY